MRTELVRCLLVVTVSSVAACAEIATVPVRTRLVADDGAPVVGRVQMRSETIDLTRTSVAEGGAARELGRGVARVMADIDPTLTSSSPHAVDRKGAEHRGSHE